jgi:hypothetical protein
MRVRHLRPELVEGRLERPGARHEDRVHAAQLRGPKAAVGRTQPPTRTVASDSAADLPAHREPGTRRTPPRDPQEHKRPPLLSPALLEDHLDLAGVPEAGVTGKPERPDGSAHNSTVRR